MMKNKKSSNQIVILFFIILYSVPIFWFARGDEQISRSVIEGRKLNKFALFDRGYYSALSDLIHGNPRTTIDVINMQFVQRNFQTDFENAASDQFPLRELGIQLSAFFDRQVINFAYMFLPDPAIPTKFGSSTFILRDKSRFIIQPDAFNESVKMVIDERIENYDHLIHKYPEISFYAFYFERLENSPYNPMNPYFPDADRRRAFHYFEENLPKGLQLGKMMLTSYEDFNSNYYATDHHWNIHGIVKAYYSIYDLLKTGYPEISAPIKFEDYYTFPNINYLGTTARTSLYPIGGEAFEVAIYDLPPYKTYEAGKEIQRNKSIEYLQGNYKTKERYTDHYVEYFGYVSPFIEYVFESNPDRNLLLIGKSFNIPLEPLIAAHYHHTYVIDFRYYEDFSLSDFMENYAVDDILIIGDNDVLFDNKDWLINQ